MPKLGGFKSYLNSNEVESDKATFKFYVDIPCDYEDNDDKEEVVSNASAFFDANIMPDLLPGEWLVARGEKVLKYTAFTDRTKGVYGTMFVTNFRISFITIDRSSYEETTSIQRNQLISEDDIPLISIESAYQVSPSTTALNLARKRKLSHGVTVTTKTKYLELHCKNFRLHRFWFKSTPIDQDKKILNAITAFGFPNRPPLLFALEYGRNSHFEAKDGRNHLYETASDWEWELDRLGGIKGWEVTQVNERYNLSDCVPECFIMPAKLSVAQLKNDSIHFVDNRPPTWSYTFVNGASLVRMAYLRPENPMTEVENRVCEAIRLSHDRGRKPTVIDLGKECPSLRDLQQSYEKLKELVLIDSEKDFWNTDLEWFSSLENTKWLQSVQVCLQLAVKAATEMEEKERTVILKESNGRDYCCIVSSLVQLMLDRQCRSIEGFQLLIQKEWVAMAHPFQYRCGLVTSTEVEESPIFLVFLDCVWQMLQQFPSSFAFTETYLTTLWDTVFTGLFETFLFNSPHQQKKLCVGMTQTTTPPIRLPSVWNWEMQYKSEYRSFFNNPLYLNRANVYSHLTPQTPKQDVPSTPEQDMAMSPKLDNQLTPTQYRTMTPKQIKVLTPKLGRKLRPKNDKSVDESEPETNGKNDVSFSQDYSRKLHKLYENVPDLRYRHVVIKPDCSMSMIRLWSQCYIRWLEPAEIIGGGSPSCYLQQCLLTEEVIYLQHKLRTLVRNKEKRQLTRPKSDLIFSYDTANTATLLQSSVMTSSFPFAPLSPNSKHNHTRVFTPLSSYLENSTLEYEYDDNDD